MAVCLVVARTISPELNRRADEGFAESPDATSQRTFSLKRPDHQRLPTAGPLDFISKPLWVSILASTSSDRRIDLPLQMQDSLSMDEFRLAP